GRQQGSVLDAGGGGLLATSGSFTAGDGGKISLAGGHGIDLSGTVQAFAIGNGGALSITAPSVRIGNQPSGSAGELLLTPDRFTQGGFSQYSVAAGLADLVLAAGTAVQPTTQTLVLDAAGARFQPTGADISRFTAPALLPVYQRKPAGLNLA